jgi:hypothetical protein
MERNLNIDQNRTRITMFRLLLFLNSVFVIMAILDAISLKVVLIINIILLIIQVGMDLLQDKADQVLSNPNTYASKLNSRINR